MDDAQRQTALTARLRSHGHDVVSPADRRQALRILREREAGFDLVVMDADEQGRRAD